MANNPYTSYYLNQVGSGLTAYEGLPYQRGHGFFGNLFSSIIKPLGRWLLPRALDAGGKIGADLMRGENVGQSLKRHLADTAGEALDAGAARAKKFLQTGQGVRRRRTRKRKAKKSTKSQFTQLMQSFKKKKRSSKKRKSSKKKKRTSRKKKRTSRKSPF